MGACIAVPAGWGVAAGLHELTCGVVVVLDAGGVFQAGDADRFAGFQRGEAGADDVAGVHRG